MEIRQMINKNLFLASSILLLVFSCKSTSKMIKTENENQAESSEKLLDSIVRRWEKSNLAYLNTLRQRLDKTKNSKLYEFIENTEIYVNRASVLNSSYTNGYGYRKSLLALVNNKFNLGDHFIINESWSGENKTVYFILGNQIITVEGSVGKFKILREDEVNNFNDTLEKIKDFELDKADIEVITSHSLVTIFKGDSTITKLSVQSLN